MTALTPILLTFNKQKDLSNVEEIIIDVTGCEEFVVTSWWGERWVAETVYN